MKIDKSALAKWGLAFIAVWFINYNGSLGRYDDQIKSCEFAKKNSQRPQREAWDAARARALVQWRTIDDRAPESVNLMAANVYLRTIKGLDRAISTPCKERFERPGLFG